MLLSRVLGSMGCVSTLTGFSMAGELAPGGALVLSGSSAAADPELGGFSQRDQLMHFEISNAANEVFISGDVQDSVTLSSSTNQLIFNRRIRNLVSTSGTARILSIQADHFANLTTVVDYRADGIGTVAPDMAYRSGGTGDLVIFTYEGTPLAPPDDTRNCFVKTNANGWGLGATLEIDAREDAVGPIFTTRIVDAARPYLLPTDRIIIQSIERVGFTQLRIEWLSITAKNYEFDSTDDPTAGWSFERSAFGGINPRVETFTFPSPLENYGGRLYRIRDVP